MTLDGALELISENHPTELMNRLQEAELVDGLRAVFEEIDLKAFIYNQILKNSGVEPADPVLHQNQATFLDFYAYTLKIDKTLGTVYDLSQEAERKENVAFNFTWPQEVKLMLALSTLSSIDSLPDHIRSWSLELGFSFLNTIDVLTNAKVRDFLVPILPDAKYDWILKAVVEETAGSKKKITAAKKAIGVA